MPTVDVETSSGVVRGVVSDGIATFLGVPFAEPPFGPLLFRPPVVRRPWVEALDCTSMGPACPQAPSQVFGALNQAEDCLSVNVWAPESAEGAPVMFWIHGGGFTFGSNAGETGAAFARDGVVFVSCNYRLGVFGFLHAGHLDDSYQEVSGAYGVADQLAALRWTQENISRFGGDPDNITIFGASAGATFVGELLGCPSARGLFRRAISQSAAGRPLLGFGDDDSSLVAVLMLEQLGVAASDLGSLDAAQFVKAQVAFVEALKRGLHPEAEHIPLPFVPRTGGDLLPRAAIEAIGAGSASDVELLLGTNRDECTLYELMVEMLGEDVGPGPWDAPEDEQERVRRVYEQHHDAGSPIPVQIAMETDRVFRLPTLALAEAHLRSGGSTRLYRLDWRSPAMAGRVGATHGLESPFVFDELELPITKAMVGDKKPGNLTREIHGAWVGFAKSGDPAVDGAVQPWPEYNLATRPTLVFDHQSRVVSDPDGEQRAIWTT